MALREASASLVPDQFDHLESCHVFHRLLPEIAAL
jgi:hypothetical protein